MLYDILNEVSELIGHQVTPFNAVEAIEVDKAGRAEKILSSLVEGGEYSVMLKNRYRESGREVLICCLRYDARTGELKAGAYGNDELNPYREVEDGPADVEAMLLMTLQFFQVESSFNPNVIKVDQCDILAAH